MTTQIRNNPTDVRKSELEQWVSEVLGVEGISGDPASTDASFRRYFRYLHNGDSWIGMDAPPPQEDCQPFVDIAELLGSGGVHVPRVVGKDLDRGYLLLSDLGTQTYLHVINQDNADELFADAIAALVRIQKIAVPAGVPAYDEALLRRELGLFPEWFIGAHLQWQLPDNLEAALNRIFDVLVDNALAQPQVLVHRDYMPRNLMISEPNPGVIDFQDAVAGPVSYDPICLFRDAFISWPEDKEAAWLQDYWQQAREAAIAVPDSFEQFYEQAELMGAQRHLKVIGIFARICHRDGKPAYLDDVPRFFGYLRAAISRRPQLAELLAVLDAVQERCE